MFSPFGHGVNDINLGVGVLGFEFGSGGNLNGGPRNCIGPMFALDGSV